MPLPEPRSGTYIQVRHNLKTKIRETNVPLEISASAQRFWIGNSKYALPHFERMRKLGYFFSQCIANFNKWLLHVASIFQYVHFISLLNSTCKNWFISIYQPDWYLYLLRIKKYIFWLITALSFLHAKLKQFVNLKFN